MPLKLLKKEREIKHNGITFISPLPDTAIPEVYKILLREKLLIHEVSAFSFEVNEPYFFDLHGRQLVAIIISDVVQISEVPQGAEL
jgi:hypothetical protein